MTDCPSTCADAALFWFRFGLPVIPLHPETKQTTQRWQPWLDQLSEKVITDHWQKHPEHHLGAIVDERWLVLDADNDQQRGHLVEIESALDTEPNMVVSTRKGEHHWFKRAPGTYARQQSFSTEHEPECIDIKTGRTRTEGRSMVVLPPSAGKDVQLLEAGTADELTEIDQGFIDAVFRHNGRQAPREVEAKAPTICAPPECAGEVLEILGHVNAGCGYDQWCRVGMALHDKFRGSDEGLAVYIDWSSKAPNAASVEEIEYKWRSFTAGHGITFASVAQMAADAGADLSAIRKRHNKGSEKKRQRFRLIRADQMEFKAPDWQIYGILEKGTLALTFGDVGQGKTFTALDMACCIATGKDYHGHAIKDPGPVIYICGEGHNGIRRRLRAWELHHGQTLDNAPLFVSSAPAAFTDPVSVAIVMDVVREVANQTGRPRLIQIDTLARNFGPGDENKTPDMNLFIAAADELKDEFSCTAMVVHHTGHAEKERARGSLTLPGACDAIYRVAKTDGLVRLFNQKMKDGPRFDPIGFDLVEVPLGITDDEGNPVTSAALSRLEDPDISALLENTAPKPVKGKWQKKAITILQDMASKADSVSVAAWQQACTNADMPRQRWHSVRDSLQASRLVEIRDGKAVLIDEF